MAVLMLSSAGVRAGLAQSLDTDLRVADRGVASIVRHGETIWIAEYSTCVRPVTRGPVATDAGPGAVQQLCPKVLGRVHAVAPDGIRAY